MPQMYCSLRGLLYSPYSPRVFGRSHVRRQMPAQTREILVAKGGTMWARINGKFCLRLRLQRQFRDFYMLQIYDMGPTALLPFRRKGSKGFFRHEKSWRLRPGLNPRTWVFKGSTLPLDHRSRYNDPSSITGPRRTGKWLKKTHKFFFFRWFGQDSKQVRKDSEVFKRLS